MIVLDTTVLVYAKGADHSLRDPCRRLISAVADARIEATTTAEVIQEFAHVRARRRDVVEAAALAGDYAELLSPLLVVAREQLDRGLSLFASVAGIGAFDAILAAAALTADATTLVSADRAFGRIDGFEHTFPDEQGISALLG